MKNHFYLKKSNGFVCLFFLLFSVHDSLGLPGLFDLTNLPAPADVSGPVNVCSYAGTGTQVVYTAAPVENATSYQWIVPPAVNIISGQGTNVLTVTFDAAFISSGNKQLRVSAIATGDSSAYTIKYLVAQLPGSVPFITGPTDVCPFLESGLEATYSIPVITAASSYQWTVPAGVNITQNNGNSISVTFDNSFVTNTISVFATNICGVSNMRNITVKRIAPSKPGIITGVPNACLFMPSVANPNGTTATYSTPRIEGNIYNWSVPAGTSIGQHSNTATTDYIEVNFTAAYIGGDISVTTSNGCGTSPEAVFKLVSYKPTAPSYIGVSLIQICPERIYQYSLAALPSNAVSAQWTVPSNATIVSGQGTNSIIVSYPGYTVGTVSVVGNNGCGSSAARTISVNIPQCQPEFTGGNNGHSTISTGKKENSLVQQQPTEANVFPNPTSTTFNLQLPAAGRIKADVKLMDLQGRVLKTFKAIPGQSLSFGLDLKAGIYFVEITQAEKTKTTRLVKF